MYVGSCMGCVHLRTYLNEAQDASPRILTLCQGLPDRRRALVADLVTPQAQQVARVVAVERLGDSDGVLVAQVLVAGGYHNDHHDHRDGVTAGWCNESPWHSTGGPPPSYCKGSLRQPSWTLGERPCDRRPAGT